MYRVVQMIDNEAFIVVFDVNIIRGGVLRHYIDKKKNRKLAVSKSKTTLKKYKFLDILNK